MRGYKKQLVQFFLGLMIVLLATGVGALAANRPRIRVVHAAPVVPSLDVYVVYSVDTLFFDNIFYSQISEYAPIEPGDRTVKARPAMTSPKDPSLIEVNAPYNNDQDYTVIVAGSLDSLQYWRLDDDNTNLPGTGSSRLRVVHASAGTPSAEICIGDVCRTLAFKEDTGYFLMDPGVYTPQVNLNGADPSYIKIPPLVLQDNSIHTVFLVGKRHGEPNLELLYTFDAGEPDANPHPPSPGQPPADHPSPPIYPPETGAFLSLTAMGMIAGAILIVGGGIGFWLTRRPRKS
jgi:hypothetical protein